MKNTPCIYKIGIGKYYYFGQTVSPRRRMNDHLSSLKKGKHHNIKMQRVYNKTFDDPRFSVVLYCEKEELNYYEQTLIDKHYDDKFNMNLNPNAVVPPNMKGRKQSPEHIEKRMRAHRGAKRSKETCKNISEAKKGKPVDRTHNIGKKASKETREKMSKAHKGNTYNCDMTMYTFVHDDGIAIECTVFDLYSSQNLDCAALWRVVKGKQKTHKGWRIK
jgi:hypothetical protein